MLTDDSRAALAALKESQARAALARAKVPRPAPPSARPTRTARHRVPWRRPTLLVWAVGLTFLAGFLNGFYDPYLSRYPLAYWLVDVGVHVLPLVLMAAAVRAGQVSLNDLGLRWTTDYKHGRLNLVVLLLTTPIVTPLIFLFSEIWGHRLVPLDWPFVLPSLDALPESRFWRGVLVYYLSISAGVVEELVFRSALLLILPRRCAVGIGYIVISAGLFGLIHWEQGPYALIAKGLFGAFMAVLYRGPRNIWPPIVSHTFIDLLATWSWLMHTH